MNECADRRGSQSGENQNWDKKIPSKSNLAMKCTNFRQEFGKKEGFRSSRGVPQLHGVRKWDPYPLAMPTSKLLPK